MAKKVIKETQEECDARIKATDIRDQIKIVSRIGQAPTKRKVFEKGESVYVSNGGLISAKISDIMQEGIYEVEITYNKNIPYSSQTEIDTRKRILGWYDIFKLSDKVCEIQLGQDMRLNFMQQQVSSLVHSYIIAFGVDFNPPYQRELVWDLEDEQKLIESVFNRVDIGKFVFIHKGYSSDLMYEILDGKQRLSTLYRFYTDQFQYKGFYYSELPWILRYTFEDTSVAVAVTRQEDLKEKDILNYFLKLNTSGKPMDSGHLEKIQNKYNSL